MKYLANYEHLYEMCSVKWEGGGVDLVASMSTKSEIRIIVNYEAETGNYANKKSAKM